MTDQHRATPEQWAFMRHRAKRESDLPSCLLELRARVKALEAAQLEQAESNRFCVDAIVRRVEALEAPMAELRAASAEARPARLVERVMDAIADSAAAYGAADEPACAAIREVAAWIRDNPGPNSAWSAVARDLMDEADRG
jgi:hypothetical protein